MNSVIDKNGDGQFRTSGSTFFFKFLVAPIWILGILGVFILDWLATGTPAGAPLIVAAVGTVFALIVCPKLKKGIATESVLELSNFRKSVDVQYEEICSVKRIACGHFELLFIRFGKVNEFGSWALLICPFRLFGSMRRQDSLARRIKRKSVCTSNGSGSQET